MREYLSALDQDNPAEEDPPEPPTAPPPPKPQGKQPEDADFTRIREKIAKSLAATRGGSVTDAESREEVLKLPDDVRS